MNYWLTLLPSILEGFKTSIYVYIGTLCFSIPLGLGGALVSRSKSKWLQRMINTFTWIIRGTPLLLQLYFVFFALPLLLPIQIRNVRLMFGLVTFVINYTAYFIEIFKGGFASVDTGQWEAAKMLDMSKTATLIYIVLPQVFRYTLHALGNECITLVKDTSLLAAVALPELLMSAKEALSRDSRIDALVIVAGVYLLFTLVVVGIIRLLGRKLKIQEVHHDSV